MKCIALAVLAVLAGSAAANGNPIAKQTNTVNALLPLMLLVRNVHSLPNQSHKVSPAQHMRPEGIATNETSDSVSVGKCYRKEDFLRVDEGVEIQDYRHGFNWGIAADECKKKGFGYASESDRVLRCHNGTLRDLKSVDMSHCDDSCPGRQEQQCSRKGYVLFLSKKDWLTTNEVAPGHRQTTVKIEEEEYFSAQCVEKKKSP